MDILELFQSAYEALKINKIRTALAGLGIVIGIGAVIALVSLGEGSQKSIQNSIQGLGANLITISPGSQRTGVVQGGFGTSQTLIYEDALAIESMHYGSISKISPEINRRTQISAGKENTNTQVVGVNENYLSVHNVSLSSGNFITNLDVSGIRNIAVVGPQVAYDLFGENVDPIGKAIRINKIPFTIVGLTISKGGTGFGNQDDIVFIPITVAQKTVFGIDYISSISMSAASEKSITQAENDAGYLLLQRHKIKSTDQADFSMFSQSDILSTASSVTGTFTSLLSGIAAISLLVGGIGIMNIMLVTVIERTREIGLRKALGAKDNLVIAQFLIEAIMLTIGGGIIGMLLGVTLSFIISMVMNIPFAVSIKSIFLAIGVSAGIGVIFGWYPAKKAADLSPIEALRYE